jgi:hypothetical protein
MGRKGSDSFRGSTQLPRFYKRKRALTTGNVVETCTLLTQYRLARGILLLPVGALAAVGASSLRTSGKGYISHARHLYLLGS